MYISSSASDPLLSVKENKSIWIMYKYTRYLKRILVKYSRESQVNKFQGQ